MKGIDVKRGVAATMERVVANSGSRFQKLEVRWYGKAAAINFTRDHRGIDATVIMPSLDELAEVDRGMFNNLIGFALHEGLGHALYTDNDPWDQARNKYGTFVGQLINGLEDPRIEQRAIDSGYAPNSKHLFETLLNSMLDRDGYVQPDDLKNIPFLLAVEGRRLNGYQVNVPSIVDQSPLAVHLHEALRRARNAFNTEGVVIAAIDLYKHIKDYADAQKPPKPEGEGQGKGDSQKPPTDDPSGSEGQSEEQGQDGQDGQGQDGQDGKPDGKDGQGGDKSDKGEKEKGKKKSDGQWSGARDVDPAGFIESEISGNAQLCKEQIPRPSISKPTIAQFHWE